MLRYGWPGNIRELRNVLERAVLLIDGEIISGTDLHLIDVNDTEFPTSLSLREVKRSHIQRVLQSENGRVDAAAVKLGIPRSTLYQRIKELDISVGRMTNM